MKLFEENRKFLKAHRWEGFDTMESDQRNNQPAPPVQKTYPKDAVLIDMLPPDILQIGNVPLVELIWKRMSHRKYTSEYLTLDELSFLLWATQGIREISENRKFTLRTVPSGGARHSFETYLLIQRVHDLLPGLYRYLPIEHKLQFIREESDISEKVSEGCRGQKFVGTAAVIFVWATIPYRAEWRYGPIAHKMIAMDSGHVCQNLYLACGSIGAGTCAVDAYNQTKMDKLVGLDGDDEFVVYVAPVGKIE